MTKIEAYLEKRFKIDASYYIRGTFWNTLSQTIVLIGGLATTVIFAKVLTATDYGTYKYIITAAALLSSFSLVGLGQSVLQTASKKYYSFYTETRGLSLLWGTGITAMGTIASLYYTFQHNYLLATGFFLIAVTQPLTNTYQNIFAFLLGSKRYRDASKAQLFNVVIMSILSIVTILITHDLITLLAVYFISNFLTFFLTHLYYRPRNSEPTPPEIYKKFISYAKHSSARNFISDVAFRFDTILIFTQLGAAEVAIYTIANLLPEQIKGSLKNINVLLLPKYSENKNIESIKKSMPIRSWQLFFILSLISCAYILLAPFVYKLLFPNYGSAIVLSQIAALSFPAMVYFIPFSALQANLSKKALYEITLSTSLIQIVILVPMVAHFGILGAIVSRIIYRYILLVISFWVFYTIPQHAK